MNFPEMPRNETAHQNPRRWVSRLLLKDGKVRTTERYFGEPPAVPMEPPKLDASTSSNNKNNNRSATLVLPSALVWRKYWRVFRKLLSSPHEYDFCLTESVVECLDYTHHQLDQRYLDFEKQRLLEMVENEDVRILLDLSFHDAEFDWMKYESMDVVERSRHGPVRMATRCLDRCAGIVLLVDDNEPRLELGQEEEINEIKLRYQTLSELLQEWSSKNPSTATTVSELQHILEACGREFETRNAPSSSTVQQNSLETVPLGDAEIQARLKDGTLLRGRLNVTKENTSEAFVAVRDKVYFVPKQYRNRAFHQDMVVIEVLPEEKWCRSIGRRRLVHHRDQDEDTTPLVEDDFAQGELLPTARVLAISQSGRRVFVCTMIEQRSLETSSVTVVPMDVRIPKLRIPTRSSRSYVSKRLKVEVTTWEMGSSYPIGHCLEILGEIGDLETEIRALLIENQVELEPFSAQALSFLPCEGSAWRVPESEIQTRKDLRTSRRIFSVDPPGCQDIDDTMHAEILPNGDVEVGVHIADVTYFVEHNSQLDLEAQARGTTFYLVDRRFDMLPSLLSSDLCSLHGGIDRLAVSAIWVLSSDLSTVKSTWFGRTVIHNCAAMTYDQADRILQNKSPDEPGRAPPPPLTAGAPVDQALTKSLKRDLTILTRLARKLRKDRETLGGAVDLSSGDSGSELKFTLENGVPKKVVPKQDKEIHHTIAELMIMANTHVATRTFKYFPQSALLRIHKSVEESRLIELRDILGSAGIQLKSESGSELAKALREAQRKYRASNSSLQSLLLSVATRAMTEAQYVCTGDMEGGADFSHYGLGLSEYTHFTSPIRRYADVIVHKQLLASLVVEELSSTKPKLVKASHVAPLTLVPDSEMISVLHGEGLNKGCRGQEEDDCDDAIDFLTEGTSALVFGADAGDDDGQGTDIGESGAPYTKADVTSICEGLNLHNRLAKQSSFECQGLFLSLFFRDHTEATQAIVTNLRENGMLVYIPRFDLRCPVYIRDINNVVQMDPGLFGLSADAGHPSSFGFKANFRRFPDGRCQLVDGPDERLEVQVPGAQALFVARPLEVVTVEISCNEWDVRARVPQPRVHMISNAEKPPGKETRLEITSESLTADDQATVLGEVTSDIAKSRTSPTTMFEVLSKLSIRPVLQDVTTGERNPTNATSRPEETLKGRMVFGKFVNPDLRSEIQRAAQTAAAAEAAQRRANLTQATARRQEYDTSRQIERNITLRQQRLAAEKRHTRRSKGK